MSPDNADPQAPRTADRLAALSLFRAVPRSELEWVADRGEVRSYSAGQMIREMGSPADEMFIVLEGRIGLHVPRGGGWRRMMVEQAGFVFGVMPYSRIQSIPGNVIVDTDAAVHVLHREHLGALIRECPAFTTELVHRLVDRARNFRDVQLNDERLLALGRVASGLAHELNNPASAAAGSARTLPPALQRGQLAFRSLMTGQLDEAQLTAIDAVCIMGGEAGVERSAIDAADYEAAIADWLEGHRIDSVDAEAIASSGVTLDALERLADILPQDTLRSVVAWVASTAAACQIAKHIQTATKRVNDLVNSVKGFTFMDREGIPEDVDIAGGLAHTVAILESKRLAKGATLRVQAGDGLPRVHGYGSEFNQIWSALIDNALDAVNQHGNVTVSATAQPDCVVVRVLDDGPGIATEHLARVFDPFFTTKPVGEGAGLGLYQARRLIHLHQGDIEVVSEPGKTEFRVRLPIGGGAPGSA